MTKISMSTELGVSADEVWKLIGGFNALPDWHPGVEKSELEEEGQMRRLSLAGGGTIIEKLVKIDDDARTYTYTITDSPLPVANYTATIKVIGQGPGNEGGCRVEWSSEFDSEAPTEGEARDVIQGIYQAGFDNLKKMFGG